MTHTKSIIVAALLATFAVASFAQPVHHHKHHHRHHHHAPAHK